MNTERAIELDPVIPGARIVKLIVVSHLRRRSAAEDVTVAHRRRSSGCASVKRGHRHRGSHSTSAASAPVHHHVGAVVSKHASAPAAASSPLVAEHAAASPIVVRVSAPAVVSVASHATPVPAHEREPAPIFAREAGTLGSGRGSSEPLVVGRAPLPVVGGSVARGAHRSGSHGARPSAHVHGGAVAHVRRVAHRGSAGTPHGSSGSGRTAPGATGATGAGGTPRSPARPAPAALLDASPLDGDDAAVERGVVERVDGVRGHLLGLHVHEAAAVHHVALGDHAVPLEQSPQLLGLRAERQAADEHFRLLESSCV